MPSRIVRLAVLVCGVAAPLHSQPPAAPDPILCWTSRSFGANPRIVVDLRLRSGNANRLPSAADVRAIAELGGSVLHRFNVAVIRASVDTTALRQLIGARTGLADVAYPVLDPTRHDVRIQVFYRRDMSAADDSTLLVLGATGLWWRPKSRVVSATLPDSLVPVVSRLPDVSEIRAQSIACIIPTGA